MIQLPDADRSLSPYTGWGRQHWEAVADAILDGGGRFSSASGSLIAYPGTPGGFGARVDGLEGFARTFMLAGFRIAGSPDTTEELAERFARGIASGVDPDSSERWPRPREIEQAKVEAAALAVGLHFAGDHVWGQLSDSTRELTIDYLADFIGAAYPPNNWAWFRIIVEQFLHNVGGPWSAEDQETDFSLLDSLEREHGWVSDGPGRSFDHYCGWALAFYPTLWADMVSPHPQHAARAAHYRNRLDLFLDDALHLIGADGSPLIQGRSLTYRFATASAAWAAAFSGTSRHSPGLLRRAATAQTAHFVTRGAPGADGILSLGWHHRWPALAQAYSGPGSPYWASKGMLGLALPADHPVWTAVEEPLPIDVGPFTRVIRAPGWIADGTPDDGLVRIINHGTDHRAEGERQPDAPLYAKLGYSTATSPVLTDEPGMSFDGTVSILRRGEPSQRSGFTRGELVELESGTAMASSAWPAHWPRDLRVTPDHGTGASASGAVVGPWLDVVSYVRAGVEVRFVLLRSGEGLHEGDVLRVAGWGLSHDDVRRAGESGAVAGRLRSRVEALLGFEGHSSGVTILKDVAPLAGRTAVPWLAVPAHPRWYAAAVQLGTGEGTVRLVTAGPQAWTIIWPGGGSTTVRPGSAAAVVGDRGQAREP